MDGFQSSHFHHTKLIYLSLLVTLFFYLSSIGSHLSSSGSEVELTPTSKIQLSQPSVYHFPEIFLHDYAEMERRFRVYVYADDEDDDSNNLFHASRKLIGSKHGNEEEGYFFKNIRESRLRTKDPQLANLFLIPISIHRMQGKGVDKANVVEGLIKKYPYRNRTNGADHFLVTYGDGDAIGVRAIRRVEFSPRCDGGGYMLAPSRVSQLPQMVGENGTEFGTTRNRKMVQVHQKHRFCICHVDGEQIADSIRNGCVPAILSNYNDLPFNNILDWRKFSVILEGMEADHELKPTLESISDQEFASLYGGLMEIRKHFVWQSPAVQFDAFHMTMYEIWLQSHAIKY